MRHTPARHHGRHEPVQSVQSVTSAPESLRDEQAARIRRYLLTMGVRTACFVLAVVTTGWVRWTCVVLAVVLPYIAVVLANAVRPRVRGRLGPVEPEHRPPPRALGR
jgi:hypothetical protein